MPTILEVQDAAFKLAMEGLNAKVIARRLDCHYHVALQAVRRSHHMTPIPACGDAGAGPAGLSGKPAGPTSRAVPSLPRFKCMEGT